MRTVDWPDAWSVMKIIYTDDNHQEAVQYRLLCGWIGGFAVGDEWRLNSGIVSVELNDDVYIFRGKSGSTYQCHQKAYSVISIMNDGISQVERMSDVLSFDILSDCDWENFDFSEVYS